MIEFKNVSFSYEGQEHDSLHGISLTIADGECAVSYTHLTHCYFELDADGLDTECAETAWNLLIQRHGMMRVIIQPDGMQPVSYTHLPAAYAGSPCPRPLYAGYESERYCRNGGYHTITGGKIHPRCTAEAAPVLCASEMDGQSISVSKEKRCMT